MCRGKTRQGAPDVVARSLGQAEAYLTVREVLAETSTGADGMLWRECGGFGRFRFATLGFTLIRTFFAAAYLVVNFAGS
jgi:hypothetical protein